MTSGQDVSESLDTLGLVKSYFSSFLSKKIKNLFAGLLANPDMPLSQVSLEEEVDRPEEDLDTVRVTRDYEL